MKIKTAELTGNPLSWALAVVLGEEHDCKPAIQDGIVWMPVKQICFGATNTDIGGHNHIPFDYVQSGVCFGLIKQKKLEHKWPSSSHATTVFVWGGSGKNQGSARGQILEEAVARCVVAMRLGDEVDVPDELAGVQS